MQASEGKTMLYKDKISPPGRKETGKGAFPSLRLAVMLVILILSSSFGCQQFSVQKKASPPPTPSLGKYLSRTFPRAPLDQQAMEQGRALFVEKCSACHDPQRAFSVIKDPEIWAQTIKRMQYYSQGAISNEEAEVLVSFHITEQQREINAFKETCTKCHNDERIDNRSMSEEQWLATIRRMQKKAPELITDEKINLLAAYFHRRELAMARIFYGKCGFCHLDGSDPDPARKMNGLIVLANEEFGRSMQVTDARNLISSHVQRQDRDMQIYEKDCTTCHPSRPTGEKEKEEERTRAEWISFIALRQGIELNKEIQNTINYQIEFHISRH